MFRLLIKETGRSTKFFTGLYFMGSYLLLEIFFRQKIWNSYCSENSTNNSSLLPKILLSNLHRAPTNKTNKIHPEKCLKGKMGTEYWWNAWEESSLYIHCSIKRSELF